MSLFMVHTQISPFIHSTILFFYCFLHIFPYCHVTIAVIFLQYYLNDTLNIVALLSFLGRNPVHDQS